MVRSNRSKIVLTALAFLIIAGTARAADKAFNPCALLTPAEIQSALGEPVKPGTAKVQANPLAGADCTYVIGDFGSCNVAVKPRQAGETTEKVKAMFAKMNMKPVDLPGVGDGAFFTSPGFEMVQLHAFKGAKYALITLLDPKRKEAEARPLAAKLMKMVLTRI